MIEAQIVHGEKEVRSEYPIIKRHKHTKTIVLFISPRTGVALSVPKQKPPARDMLAGHWSNFWMEDEFEVYDATLQLRNKI